jgi:group I intron endonuclease
MKKSGIYKIQSIIKPERYYIGSAIHIPKRWCEHKCLLKNNKHHSPMLQKHYNKYGLSDLIFIIIEPCLPEFLTIREDAYIKPIKPYFNVCDNAGNTLGFKYSKEQIDKIKESRKDYRPSKETKAKISESLIGNKRSLGYKQSDETKKKISDRTRGKNNPRYGIKLSEETKQKIRAKAIGRKISKESKRKISEAQLGENNHFFGKSHTQESKQKMKLKATGRKVTEETKKKISNGLKGKYIGPKNSMYGVQRFGKDNPMYGKHWSEESRRKRQIYLSNIPDETRRKLSEAGKLRKHTPEELIRMSEAQKKAWIIRKQKKVA